MYLYLCICVSVSAAVAAFVAVFRSAICIPKLQVARQLKSIFHFTNVRKTFKCVWVTEREREGFKCVITAERGNHNQAERAEPVRQLASTAFKWPWRTFCWRVNLIHLKLSMSCRVQDRERERERGALHERERTNIYFVKELKLLSSKWPWRTNNKRIFVSDLRWAFEFYIWSFRQSFMLIKVQSGECEEKTN